MTRIKKYLLVILITIPIIITYNTFLSRNSGISRNQEIGKKRVWMEILSKDDSAVVLTKLNSLKKEKIDIKVDSLRYNQKRELRTLKISVDFNDGHIFNFYSNNFPVVKTLLIYKGSGIDQNKFYVGPLKDFTIKR